MKRATVYLMATAGLWLLLLSSGSGGGQSGGYESTGRWFKNKISCEVFGDKIKGSSGSYICVESVPRQ